MELIILVVSLVILAELTLLTVLKFREKKLRVARGSLLLDTSAIMDGRIVDVASTGIITAELIVPRSVIAELQLLADKADSEKRARARHGLDNVKTLQKLDSVSVTVVNDGQVGHGGVDERLLELAKRYDANICTTDYNLNKVAKVMGITVVNVNELSQMLRAQVLPGEQLEIQLLQAGANRDQAVGYLDDGTMVVVEDAKNQIGQKVRVEITRSLQTEAGRMMFAKRVRSSHPAQSHAENHAGSVAKKRSINPRGRSAKSTNRAADTKTTPVIAAAPAFHSDQLNHVKTAPAEKTTQQPPKATAKTAARTPRKSSKTAESDLVALVNHQAGHYTMRKTATNQTTNKPSKQ
jgi:rRNA-processing protein FCF1